MDLKEAQELTKGKLGMRYKQENDGILIYANSWTLIVDAGKWIKVKFNKNNNDMNKIVKAIFKELNKWVASQTGKNRMRWVSVEDGLPNELEIVWVSNGKGWTTLGCLVYGEDWRIWAETKGIIYQKNGRIVSECEFADIDVKFWHRLPKPPCL